MTQATGPQPLSHTLRVPECHGFRPSFLPVFEAEGLGLGGGDLMDDTTSAFFSTLEPEEAAEEEGRRKAAAPDTETPEVDPESPEGKPADPSAERTEPKQDDPDDAELEWTVGETATRAKLRELKEAFASRADTERLRTDTAALRQKADADAARLTTGLTRMLDRVNARWEPFSKIDWLALSRDPSIDQDTFAQLRKEAQEALDARKDVVDDLDGHVKAAEAAQVKKLQETAQATFRELSDPKTGIPNWSADTYNGLLNYAVQNGVPDNVAKAWVDPYVFRLIHKASLYDKGVKAAAEKVQKVVNAPSRSLKPGAAGTSDSASVSLKSAMANLRKSGSVDDAAAAFEASFADA